MTRRLLSFLCAILTFHLLFSQEISTLHEGALTGKIIDAQTKEPLGGVNIFIHEKGIAVSDTAGKFKVQVPAGMHSLEFKLIGFSSVIKNIEVKENETTVLNVSLSSESTELGTVVVSAGKFEQKLEEVTVSMEVMKQSLVENKNTTTMEDFMQQCPGVNILDGQANIRGGSGFSYGAGTRVLVLVDDMPLLTADAGDVKWNFIPVENIEQVEVIKGASSALFGSSALNGVINIRTSYPKDTAHTSVVASEAMYDRPQRKDLAWWGNKPQFYQNMNILHSRQIKNFDLVLGANAFGDDGYRKLENENHYRFNFGTRYRFQKIKGLSAGVNGNYMDARGGYFILWQSGDSAYYPQGGSVSAYHTIRATLDPYLIYYTKRGHKHSLRTRYYEAINRNNTNQESTSKVWYGEYQYQLHLKKDLTITSGFTEIYSEVVSDSLYGRHFSNNFGVFSQLDKKFNRLIVSLGIRGEYFKVDTAETKYNFTFGRKTNSIPVHPVARAGVNYHLFSHTWIRSSFGQGYRFPSVAEKFISTKVSGLPILPNPYVQPETGWSAEVGGKQEFKISNFRGYIDVAAFAQQYKNMMEFTFGYWVPDSIKHPTPFDMLKNFGAKSINVGRAQILGTEITIAGEGKIGNVKLSVLGGYTYIQPMELDYDSAKSGGTYNHPKMVFDIAHFKKDTANELKYRYDHTAKIDVQADYKRFSTGISVRYNSFMMNIDKSFQTEIFNDILPTYHSHQYILPGLKEYRDAHNTGDAIFDLRVAYKLTKSLKVSAVVNNIFNREYMGRPGDVQPPRVYALMLAMKL